MKKLSLVNTLLLVLILLVSCATISSNENIVNTAINLANKQVELNELNNALDTYNEALKHGKDAKLLYNKAIVQAKLGDYEGAIATSLIGVRWYSDKPEFLSAVAQYYYYNNQIDEFISYFNKYFKVKKNDTNAMINYIDLCYKANLYDTAYQEALSLWNEGHYLKEVVNILYSINPNEWEVINKVFNQN